MTDETIEDFADEANAINRRTYDTLAGIESYLTDLDGLNRLIQHRMNAGYKRKERLHDWVIMGRWATDSCGNFGRCEFQLDHKPIQPPADFPKVTTRDDAFRHLANLSMGTYSSSDVPSSHLVCPECKKGWSLENAHDTFVRKDDRVVPLTPGKTIRERQKDWDSDPEGHFRFGPEPSVRNPKFIDLSPHPEYKNSKVNEKGWRYHHPPFDHERLTMDYVAEEGDECSVTVFLYFHKRCWALYKARRERAHFEEIFAGADMKPVTLNEIPNGYCPCEVCAPWFVATFPFGDIKIGWRKRVINIDWSSTGKDLEHLFKEEDVTKDPHYIHAWGAQKASEYLKRINGALA